MRVVSVFALALLSGALACTVACSLDASGRAVSEPGGDAGSLNDATSGDGGVTDAAADGDGPAPDVECPSTSLTCNGACVTTCVGCSAGASLCPATRACGHCDKCSGYELECFACAGGTGAATGFCAMPARKCGVAVGNRCACRYGEPMDCPGKSQVCVMGGADGQCLSCGDDGSLNITCANGLICNDNSPAPPTCTGS